MRRASHRRVLALVCGLAVPACVSGAEDAPAAAAAADERTDVTIVEPRGRVYEVTDPAPAPKGGGVELITGGSSEHGAARVGRMPVME